MTIRIPSELYEKVERMRVERNMPDLTSLVLHLITRGYMLERKMELSLFRDFEGTVRTSDPNAPVDAQQRK